MLRRRAELLQRLRTFFAERGFLEVDTPILSRDVVVDRHLDPFRVTLFANPREPDEGPTYFLQTSPEFALKRLVTAFGNKAPALFQVAKAFRGGGERGRLHNPEFTLIEWYRVGDDYAAGRRLLSDLAERTLGRGPATTLTYREAFLRFAELDPFSATDAELATAAKVDGAFARGELLDLILVRDIEPHLGRNEPQILCDYPPDQAALAQVRGGVAERFELYVDGMELANGYHELLNPDTLRERNRQNNTARIADGKPTLPEDSRLLAAMEHGLPPCVGCALGFDRLLMAATGAKSIDEVIAFPSEWA